MHTPPPRHARPLYWASASAAGAREGNTSAGVVVVVVCVGVCVCGGGGGRARAHAPASHALTPLDVSSSMCSRLWGQGVGVGQLAAASVAGSHHGTAHIYIYRERDRHGTTASLCAPPHLRKSSTIIFSPSSSLICRHRGSTGRLNAPCGGVGAAAGGGGGCSTSCAPPRPAPRCCPGAHASRHTRLGLVAQQRGGLGDVGLAARRVVRSVLHPHQLRGGRGRVTWMGGG